MPTAVRVTIKDSAVTMELSSPAGDNWAFMRKIGQEHAWQAALRAPSRTSNLKRSHNLALTPRGTTGVQASVGNYADYARYVHEGTQGPITAHGWDDGSPAFMAIRPAPHSWFPGGGFARSVAGQTANPWIAEAAEDVYPKYGFKGPFVASWG